EVDDEPAHHPRGIAYEALSVREYRLLLCHPEIGFVQESRGADRAAHVTSQLALGQLTQTAVERDEELLVCRSAAHAGSAGRFIGHERSPGTSSSFGFARRGTENAQGCGRWQ